MLHPPFLSLFVFCRCWACPCPYHVNQKGNHKGCPYKIGSCFDFLLIIPYLLLWQKYSSTATT